MVLTKRFVIATEEQTACLASQFAAIAQKGDVFALSGTLGVGKSVFARAFIKKLTSIQDVPSPTFTLVQSYPADDFEIYHFDLYRIKSPEEVIELGFDDLIYSGVSLIEWPEYAGYLMPKDIFKINIDLQQDQRIFDITVYSHDKAERLEKINNV